MSPLRRTIMRWAPVLALPLLAACAPVPRPNVLAQADAVRTSAAGEEARRHAPAAFAHAEKLRREADAAFEAGDLAGSQILGERAIAAYAHAQALGRLARAEEGGAAEVAEVERLRAELAIFEADQRRVAAEIDAIELRIKVARDAQPVSPSGPADPAREEARLAAARALALQARLLCTGARLLLGNAPAAPTTAEAAPADSDDLAGALQVAEAGVAKLEGDLSGAQLAPIDASARARAACLSVLAHARRKATPVTRAPGTGDELLASLSAAGSIDPSRDDRGVVVTLRDLFKGSALTAEGEKRVAQLGRVAAAHPDFPVTVVLHQDRPSPSKDAQARADAVVKALAAAQATRVTSVLAGVAAPIVDPAGRDRARNARVEIVFVTPEML